MPLADAADVILDGDDAKNRGGTSVDFIGDFDGDGLDDIAVGAPDAAGTNGWLTGAAYVVRGGVSESSVLDDAALLRLDGASPTDSLGNHVAGAGDVNGDGLADLLVHAGDHGGTLQGFGAVYLILGGQSGTLDAATHDLRIEGRTAEGFLGGAMDCAGDVDGDGLDDLYIGFPGDNFRTTRGGTVYLLDGGGI